MKKLAVTDYEREQSRDIPNGHCYSVILKMPTVCEIFIVIPNLLHIQDKKMVYGWNNVTMITRTLNLVNGVSQDWSLRYVQPSCKDA